MKTEANWKLIVVLSGLLAGCCPLNERDDPCGGNEATVRVGPGQLHIRPECVSTVPGGTVTLHLRLAEGVGKVETVPKSGAAWLKTVNTTRSRRETIVINVPEDACPGGNCEFRYEIRADGVGMLDPRVRVR